MKTQNENLKHELAVERALDRVRTAAFEMRGPDDLKQVAGVMFEALDGLGIGVYRCSIDFIDEVEDRVAMWVATEGEIRVVTFAFSEWLRVCPPVDARVLDVIESLRRKEVAHFQWKDTRALYEAIGPIVGFDRKTIEGILAEAPEPFYNTWIPLAGEMSSLELALHRPLTHDELAVTKRFAEVFDFAYGRYLELKRLEDQNRELQVEAALEHVRARALGMQESDEIAEVSRAMYDELRNLGYNVFRAMVWVLDDKTNRWQIWSHRTDYTVQTGGSLREAFTICPDLKVNYDAWKRGESVLQHTFTDEEYRSYLTLCEIPESDHEALVRNNPDPHVNLVVFYSHGYVGFATDPPLEDTELPTLQRFANVFDFAYDRFLELKRLEDQNRELQVEAALAHVRSRALGMQSSLEIPDVVEALFTQIGELGLPLWRCGIVFFGQPEGNGTAWLTTTSGTILGRTEFSMAAWRAYPFFGAVYESWAEGKTHRGGLLELQALGQAVEYARENLNITFPEYEGPEIPVEALYHVWARFDEGCLFIALTDSVSDKDAAMLDRFAEVFGFSYSRMQELERVEEQARQAERRAAVDHIRAEIAAMQTTEDFERVTPLLWQTLKVLGVPFVRCGFTINDRETESIQMYLSDAKGDPMAVISTRPDRHAYLQTAWDRWMAGESYVQSFTRDEFVGVQLAIQPGLESLEGDRYVAPERLPDRLVSHMVPFSHGVLYVNSTEPLSRVDLAFVGDLAGAFSVAYARYQDFRQLERQNEDLEEASRVKSRFLANMSHELRTPMNAIIGFTQLVLRRAEGLSERHRTNLEKVRQSADHLLALINDVLDLSKIEANKMDLKPERFVVKELIAASCATVSPLVKGGVELSFDVAEDVGEAVQDAGRLRQVMINLLSNALKFTDRGTVEVSVGLEAGGSLDTPRTASESTRDEAAATLVISVADTGTGIPEADLEAIFQEFTQVDGSATRRVQGTGLGLSICRMLTELMGGTISVESEVGKGSVFTVRVPRKYGQGQMTNDR